MKKYLISGFPLCGKLTGIPRSMLEILLHLDNLITSLSEEIEITICYPSDCKFTDEKFSNIKVISLERGKKKWLPQIVVPYANKNGQIICDMADGFCFQKGGIVKYDDVRPAVAKFDPLWARVEFYLKLIFAWLNASVIVTVSESQKRQLQRLLPGKRVVYFPNGYSQLDRFISDKKIFSRFPEIKMGEYYYCIGSIAKHKNFKWIYEVALRNPQKQFVVAGNQNLKKWGIEVSSIQAKNIIYVGFVSDDENKALYENCKLLLHPSLYEGFGMPPLEAVSLGKDIAVSRLPEFYEVYGDNISYIDPYNFDFDLDNVKHLSDDIRKRILAKYTWENCAKGWLNLLLSNY